MKQISGIVSFALILSHFCTLNYCADIYITNKLKFCGKMCSGDLNDPFDSLPLALQHVFFSKSLL